MKRGSCASQNDHFRGEDRYTGDGQETDGRTTPILARSVHAESSTNGWDRYLERPVLDTRTVALASRDKGGSVADMPLGEPAEPGPGERANQPSCPSEKSSERSDPLTSHEQRIKKPVPSTPGDRP